jgi:hypothetical protein
VIEIKNLKYIDAAHTRIDLEFSEDGGEFLPFTYDPSDNEKVSLAVRELLATDDYAPTAFVEGPPQVPPFGVTPLQLRKALRSKNKMDDVMIAIKTLPDDMQESWQYATTIRRDADFVLEFAAVAKLTPAELDGIFILANTYPPD